ncbi:MAG TPA: anthranilate phosphoribosyltransferase [Actinomycetota bacterium]|nr:anthranilate phosphoribosyltransferase [Actinomycetota bacterium]
MALRDSLHALVDGRDLTSDEAAAALDEIVTSEEAEPALVSAFLVALRMKGETPDEIAGLARSMRSHAIAVKPARDGLVDTCGTGGDGTGTVNVSTTASFVVAGAGLPVAKHGNRALSSKAGSADVLEALGVRLDLSAEQVASCIDTAGIGFMFAPAFHPAMAKVMPVRRALGVRTAFNVLGPLTNPARPSYQLVGVGSRELGELVAGALARTEGLTRALVVHGAGGADELTLAGPNDVWRVEDRTVSHTVVDPQDTGLDPAPLWSLGGGDPASNARRLREVLEGRPGPVRDCVLLNAGAAFVAAGAAGDLREGIGLAAKSVDSGDAAAALERLIAASSA